ncbi:MAG: sulfur carrier protein ThiS [Prevotellaceae bacterium]|nr:sulfur carrier protein ThiS [Prevotellaceae bacterium]
MKIIFNNREVVVATGLVLLELLEAESFTQKKGIAVAINNRVIPRVEWASFSLSENDKILVITATRGG